MPERPPRKMLLVQPFGEIRSTEKTIDVPGFPIQKACPPPELRRPSVHQGTREAPIWSAAGFAVEAEHNVCRAHQPIFVERKQLHCVAERKHLRAPQRYIVVVNHVETTVKEFPQPLELTERPPELMRSQQRQPVETAPQAVETHTGIGIHGRWARS